MDHLDALYDAAIAGGDAEAIAKLEMEADILDYDGETILHLESQKGNTERVRFILRQFANKFFLTKLTKNKRTALHLALYEGHTEVAEVLIEAARQQLPETSFQAFLRQVERHGGRLYTIMNRYELYDAAIVGDVDAIAKLELEADILNKDEETILHVESQNGNTKHVQFILREFAYKNLLVKLNIDKDTALHLAAYYGHTEVVEVVIDAARHLSSASSDDDNPVTSFESFLTQGNENLNTALHFAVMEGNLATVKLLVEADPAYRHTPNHYGKTPIYNAVEKGHNDVVEIISTTCRALSLDGPGGSTALHAAIKNHSHDIELVEVLIDAARRLPSFTSDNDNSDDDDDDIVTSFQAFLRKGDKDLNSALL